MTTPGDVLSSPQDEFHLACLLLSPSGVVYLAESLEALDPEDFDDPAYSWMWAAARVIHGRGDRVTKRSLLALRDAVAPRKQPGEAQAAPGLMLPGVTLTAPAAAPLLARLNYVSGEPVFTSRIRASINAIRENAQRRRMVHVLDQLRSEAVTAEDYAQVLASAQLAFDRLEEGDLPVQAKPFSELVGDFAEWQAGGLVTGQVVPTPWPELNNALSGGLHPQRVFVIAGRPGEGKSICGLNCAQYAAEQGYRSLVVSQEMPSIELAGRMMASGARVEYGEITRFAMSEYTAGAVSEYCERNRDMPLSVVDQPGMTVEQVGAISRAMNRRDGLDLLVVDYLQLLKASDPRAPMEQRISHISAYLHNLARELECALMVLAQLNRGNVKAGRRPEIADLRGSGSIEQDADAVILMYHPLTDEGDPTGVVLMIIGKSRFGPKVDIELRWRGHQARIGESWAA